MMMKKTLILALLCCLCLGAACGESEPRRLPIDFSGGSPLTAENLTETGYSDDTITVTITSGYEARCEYWVADIVIKDASQLRTVSAGGFDSSAVATGTRLATRVNAVLAINGDYYSSAERKGLGYVIRQGITYRDNLEAADGKSARLMDVLLIDEDGDFHVLHRPVAGTVPETVDGKRIINSFSFGPILVENGELVTDFKRADRWFDMAPTASYQRVAICQVGPLHYKIVVCGGPSLGSKGMTLPQFAELVSKQGVQTAYNLDGGNSSIMILGGTRVNGVNHDQPRKLLDIIYFASAQ